MPAFAITDNLNWAVETRPLFYSSSEGTPVLYSDRVAVVRTDNEVALGVVSQNFETVQNDVLLSKVQPLADEGLLTIENMGYLNHGAKVFIQAKIAEEFRILGEEYEAYISLLNGHVGNHSVAIGSSNIRVICGNTFAAAYSEIGNRFRHSEGVNTRVLDSTTVMDYVNRNMQIYSEKVEVMAKASCKENDFHKALEVIHGKTIKEMRNVETLNRLFYGGQGNEGRTYYDAFNAITEFGSNHSRKTSEGRFNYVNFGSGAKVSARAMEVLHEMATV
jgi:phage/plasmid-like protein (TIGR03299 family)